MLEVSQIKSRLANALAGNEPFGQFADWLSKESASLRFNDSELLNLVDSILSPLQVYLDNLISEAKLRSELKLLISDDVQSVSLRFILDDSSAIYNDVSGELPKPDLKPAVNSQSQLATASFAT